MIHKYSCEAAIRRFQQQYKALMPDAASIMLARELWQAWEQTSIAPPDIDQIAADYAKHENCFFHELVQVAEKLEQRPLHVHFCQFSLERYNAYAMTAKDGYIILVDDVFLQFLFVLTNIIVIDAMGGIRADERAAVKTFTGQMIETNYFKRDYVERNRVDLTSDNVHSVLLKRDPELTEFAGYVFHAFKAFIISHEIGHHVLGHTAGVTDRVFAANGDTMTVETDDRPTATETQADHYGYKLFTELCIATDESVYYAYCVYKFPFAPILLFTLFDHLDRLEERWTGCLINYTQHPHPAIRIKDLCSAFRIEDDLLFHALKASLSYYLS